MKLLKHLFSTLVVHFGFSILHVNMMMKLSISHSSCGAPPTMPPRCKAFSYNDRFIPLKSTAEKIVKPSNFPSKFPTNNLMLPVGLYGKSRFSRSSLYGQHNRISIQACAKDEAAGFTPVVAKITRFGSTCCKFMRLYAIYQAVLSTISIFGRVFVENPQLFKWSSLFKAFPGLIAIILAHSYLNGINQIYDLDIDRVNKPDLPVAAGELSIKQAWMLVIFFLLAGLSILRLMNADPITTSLYCLGLFISTIYSAPPIRFKRDSLATSILLPLSCSGLNNLGVLYATRASLGLQFLWSPPTVFIISLGILHFMVICIAKDLPDIEGDLKYNIQTFPAIFGPRNVTFFCTGVLLLSYIGAILAAIYLPQAFKSHLLLPAHVIFAVWLLFQARKVDRENYSQEAGANFYKFVWKLLKLEFLFYPFI